MKFRVKASAIALDYCKANALATGRFLFDRTHRPEIRFARLCLLWVKSGTFREIETMSAFPPKADIDADQETAHCKIEPTYTVEICGGRRGFSETKQSLSIAVINHVAMR